MYALFYVDFYFFWTACMLIYKHTRQVAPVFPNTILSPLRIYIFLSNGEGDHWSKLWSQNLNVILF